MSDKSAYCVENKLKDLHDQYKALTKQMDRLEQSIDEKVYEIENYFYDVKGSMMHRCWTLDCLIFIFWH